MRLGCHLSVSKGFVAAVNQAPKLGANCFQYFTKNPRGFRGVKPLNQVDAAAGKARMAELDLVAVGHTPYLINLASADDELFRLSTEALVQDLVIAEARGTYGVVVHCGKPKDMGRPWGIQRMQDGLARVLDQNPTQGVRVLLENTAGQGSEIGTTVEELLEIAAPFPPHLIGFCFDTQHALSAGILTVDNPRDFPGFANGEFMERLQAIHLNDSKVPFGGHRDRHELIGHGFLGSAAIAQILTDNRLQQIPFYLETPVEREAQYAAEIAACRLLQAG